MFEKIISGLSVVLFVLIFNANAVSAVNENKEVLKSKTKQGSEKIIVEKKITNKFKDKNDFNKNISNMRITDNDSPVNNEILSNIENINKNIEHLKNGGKQNIGIKLLEEKLTGVAAQHDTIFNVVTILLSAIAIFGIGGIGFSIYETKAIKNKYNKILTAFEAEKNQALLEFEDQRKEMLRQYDLLERISRLGYLLQTKNYDSEIFFADLSQLSLFPNQLMYTLISDILSVKSEFDPDVIKLADKIERELVR